MKGTYVLLSIVSLFNGRVNLTSTCLLELKDVVLENMDVGKPCVIYILDLIAAFDMLRRDTL